MPAMEREFRVTRLAPEEADVERLVVRLARIINDAYAVGEAGLWLNGAARTDVAEVTEAIRRGEMLLATGTGRIEGCARVRSLDDATADLGMLAVPPDRWGSGAGRALMRFAEEVERSCGTTAMQLELLVPRGWVHPEKKRLFNWYTRLGYTVTRTAPFDEVAAHLGPQLRVPCEFLVFHKKL